MATYSRAGQYGPAAIPGAPRGVPLRVVDAAGSDAVLYRDASKNKVAGPALQSTDAGLVTFFADPGTYTVRWTGGSASVAITGGTIAAETVDATTVGASPLRPPVWVQASSILTALQPSHGWSNNANSTLATDTGDYAVGSQSVKITTAGTGIQANLSRTGMSSFDATGKAIRIRFKVSSGFANMAEIGCFVGSSSFANFYKWSVQVVGGSRIVQPGEWVIVTLNWCDATSSGSPDRAALTDARFYVIDDNTGVPVSVNWQSIELIPDGSATWPNGVFTFAFDDSYASQWTLGKKTLDTYGFPATAFTISEYVDAAGRLTLDQLKTMQDRCGWEIAGHAATGVNHSTSYTGLTAEQLAADIRTQRAWLLARGFRAADGTAFPLGQYGLTADNLSTLDIVRANWGYARTTHSRTTETYPPADRWRLRAMSGISTFAGGITPSSITTASTGFIDRCKANKGWGMFVFHDILSSGPLTATSQILASDFDAIVAAVSASGVPVRTVADVLRIGS